MMHVASWADVTFNAYNSQLELSDPTEIVCGPISAHVAADCNTPRVSYFGLCEIVKTSKRTRSKRSMTAI